MASALRMLGIGIVWLSTMAILGYMAYIGGMWIDAINDFVTNYFAFSPYWAGQIGLTWWWEPLYFTVILLVAIAATYRCYQEIIIATIYYPEVAF